MREILELLIPVIVILLSFAAWTLFIFIRSNASTTVKVTAVPLVLIAVVAVTLTFSHWLGRAVPLPLPDEMVVIAHRTIVKNSKKTTIEIWTKEKETTRLYTTPYSKWLEDQLKAAEQGRAQGAESRMTRRKPRMGEGERGNPGLPVPPEAQSPYDLKLEQPSDIAPKNGPITPEQDELLEQQEQQQQKDKFFTT